MLSTVSPAPVSLTTCAFLPLHCLQLPLLPPSDKEVELTHGDLKGRAAVSPVDLPSCCFFTVLNSRHGGLTAVTASPDTKYLAGAWVVLTNSVWGVLTNSVWGVLSHMVWGVY
jgi:hypothetical protein